MQIYTFLSDSRPHNKIYILWQRPYTIIIYIIENYIFVIKQPFYSYISTILQQYNAIIIKKYLYQNTKY